jgi:multiple sugar transport system permease protein
MNQILAPPQDARKSYLNPSSVLVIGGLAVLALLMAFPFLWMLSASLKDQTTVFNMPPELWPHEWRWRNYLTIINNPIVPFPQLFLNSLKIAVLITLGQLATCTLAAYAFARLRFPGRNFLFILLLSAVMIPGQVTIVPLFILMRLLGLIDSHGALILPDLVNIFGIFLLRQFFMTIPDELEDAARIDGASPLRILWQIIVPLSGPALSTLAVLTFVASWNNFFGPFIFINTWSKMTWPLGLVALNATAAVGGFEANVSVMMAGITLAFVPAFLLFLFAQRFLIESITFTGLKQ